MTTELFANNFQTTLATACAAGDTTLVMSSSPPSALQTGGQFRVLIDGEIIIVPAQATTNWLGVTRGAEGTTATSHAAGAVVTHLVTAGAIANITGLTNPMTAAEDLIKGGSSGTPTRLAIGSTGQKLSVHSDSTLKYTSQPFIDARDYGVVANNNTTDDTTALQNAVDAAANGTLLLPMGSIKITNPITISSPTRIVGHTWNTNIYQYSAVDGFVIASDFVAIQNMVLTNVSNNFSQPSAGIGIHKTSGGYTHIDHVDVFIWVDCISFESTLDDRVTNCYLGNATRYCLYNRNILNVDNGDSLYQGTTFAPTSTGTGLRIESGGGPRIIGNKFVGGVRGIDLQIADGASTSILTCAGNSLENQTTNCIRAGRLGTTGIYTRLNFTGNLIGGYQIVGTNDVVLVTSAGLSRTVLSGNIIEGAAATTGIHVGSGADGTQISSNRFSSHSVGIQNDGTNTTFNANQYETVTTLVQGSGTQAFTDAAHRSIKALTYGTTVTPDATAGIWQTLTVTNATAFTVAAPTNTPGTFTQELTIEILNSSGGAMGVITWNSAFKFTGQTWTNPASTKKRWARFEWNSTSWVCTGVATADY